jgi:predicted acyltransferase
MATSTVNTAAALRTPEGKVFVEQRHLALDAFRGFIMLMLASEAFGFSKLLDHATYGWIARQFEHVRWEGLVFWDLIQPSFMFMVGVAMPFAFAKRTALGATPADNLRHVLARFFKLILLSQILISIANGKPGFQLINVLSQIAFTYVFCYLLMQLRFRSQAIAAALILAAHWALFLLFPGPDGAFSKTDNIGAVIDRALGLHYGGYYVTINCISSTVTTLFGVWTGMLFRSDRTRAEKLKILVISMVACFAGGLALSLVNPMVKRLWTASFTLYSTGWVLLMMLIFFALIEMAGWRKLAFPFQVVGSNSVFIYSLSMVLAGWIRRAVGVFTGEFQFVGDLAPVALYTSAVLVMWCLCYWLYRNKIFLRL